MFSKLLKISLATILLLSSTSSALPALAEKAETKEVEETTTDPPAVSEAEDTSTDESAPAVTSKELDSSKADTIRKDVHKILVSLGGTGDEVSLTLTDSSKKVENSKIFTDVLLAQLQLYELFYSTEIEQTLDKPVTAVKVGKEEEFAGLTHYITAYNAINDFVNKQAEALEATDGHDANLLKAIKTLNVNTGFTRKDTITTEKPLPIETIRTELQKAVNASTALAIAPYFTYLNGGKDHTDTTALLEASLKDTTKDLINLVKQWGDLPHIANADDSIKLLAMSSANAEWLGALTALVESMTTDTNGETTTEPTAVSTAPELATSVLGRLGSSLFSVTRSDSADDDPNKPLTGTLGWTLGDVKSKAGEKFDPGPAAKDNFLAMFAATSMYIPMISKVGDTDYIEAYKALFNDTSEPLPNDSDKVVFAGTPLGPLDILSQVQNLKKPLYFYNDLEALGTSTIYGSSTSDVKGLTRLLTVSDLMTAIEKKKEIAAVTMHGVLEQSSDSWAFYNYSLNKDNGISTTVPTTVDPNEESETVVVETSQPVTDTATSTNSNSNANAGIPMTNKIPAEKDVNGGQETTRVVFEMTYNDKTPGAALLTGALMHNIYEDTVIKSRFKERQNEAVYLDAVGNIILNDGLVILPASANPTYWAIPNGLEGEGADLQLWTYNPFTVAFMDSYPAIYESGTAPPSANNTKDKNKYMMSLFNSFNDGFSLMPIKKGFKTSFTAARSGSLYDKFKLDGIPEANEELPVMLHKSIGVDKKDEIANDSWINLMDTHPVKFQNLVTNEGNSIFPYINHQVSDPNAQESFNTNKQSYASAIIIAKNMYAYILGEVEGKKERVTAASGTSAGGSSAGKLREGFLFNNVTMPVLTGITNGSEFDKSNAKADLLLAGGDTGLVQKWIINSSKWLSVASSKTSNILAVSNPDEVSLLGLLYGVLIEYGFYIIFIFLILLIILFIRQGDFFASVMKGGLISALLFVTLFLVPALVPWLTGVTTSALSRDTVLNTLMTKLELTEKVHTVEPAGNSGTSVKLYNLSPEQAKKLNNEHFIDGNYLTNKFSINDNLGMYVQGTDLRLDLYSFMRFDSLIVSTKDNVNDPNDVDTSVPQIYHSNHSKSVFIDGNDTVKEDMTYSNDLLNFYMPYNLIQDGFMSTLNKYLKHYDPPQSIVRYPNGLVKSSYIMNSYMKSLAFLSAEPEVAGLISKEKTEDGYSHLGITKAEVDLVNQEFYPYGDVLGLQLWVDTEWQDLPNTFGSSLWGQNLYNLGYYDQGSGIEKRVQVANRVNRKAYDIIMRMADTKGLVSDETMIKIVTLYATMEFNKEISYGENNIYPRTASLNEISATDILTATILGQSKQFMFYDTSLVSNVYYEEGIVGLGFLNIALASLVGYSLVLSLIMPMLIIGLLFYTIYLILTNKNVLPALKFVFKLLVLTLGANLVLLIVIRTYPLYTNIYVYATLLFLVTLIFVYLLYRIVFNKRDRVSGSWQNKHLRRMGGRRNNGNDYYGNNQYGYGNNQYGYGNDPYGYGRDDGYNGGRNQYDRSYGNNNQEDVLREESGSNSRRGSNSGRYNY